jgi:cell division protein FtsI (penicillin-binding protein 3)
MRSADVRRSAKRVAIARAALVLAFAALSLRAAHLSVFDHRGATLGDAQSLRTLTLAPERGHVVDRNGAALALSVDAPSVYAVPAQLENRAVAARRLAAALGLDARALRARLQRGEGFQFVARWITPEQERRVQALELQGVGVIREPRRAYPHRGLASRVIGFANIDGRGVRGIEQQEDEWLRGTTRRLPVERDGSGRLMLANGDRTWGTAGGDIALTLDAALQADAERALEEAIEASGARGGSVFFNDTATTEIYTLAESPSFDPNHFRSLDYASTRSGAFLDSVEAGSALKMFLVAAARPSATRRHTASSTPEASCASRATWARSSWRTSSGASGTSRCCAGSASVSPLAAASPTSPPACCAPGAAGSPSITRPSPSARV